MHTKTVLRDVRLASGLILMAFVVSHLANLSLGLPAGPGSDTLSHVLRAFVT